MAAVTCHTVSFGQNILLSPYHSETFLGRCLPGASRPDAQHDRVVLAYGDGMLVLANRRMEEMFG